VRGLEYRQLVENYRENGRHRQRVLAHLGNHETLEDAIEAARAKVEAANTDKLARAQRARRDWEYTIHKRFDPILDEYHDGDIPPSDAVLERARMVREKHIAPHTDEVVGTNFIGRTIYGYAEVEVPEEVEEYRRAFGGAKERTPGDLFGVVSEWGSRYAYDGLWRFKRQLGQYELWSARAEKLEHVLRRRRARLEKLEAVAENVVTKPSPAPAGAGLGLVTT
jgi:hypothetical protein